MANLCKRRLHKLPWYHQLALLDKLQTAEEQQWYAAQALENGWSRKCAGDADRIQLAPAYRRK